MSNSPGSTGGGPSSSPYAGTDLTSYSPETVRKGRTQTSINAHASSVARGKQPVSDVQAMPKTVVKGIEYNGLHPQPHKLGTFTNELSVKDENFFSRYLFIARLPNGVLAGQNKEMELRCVQEEMKQFQVFSLCVASWNDGMCLRFDNSADACQGMAILEMLDFECVFVDNYDFAIIKCQDTATINEFEGQIKLAIKIEPSTMSYAGSQSMQVFAIRDLVQIQESVEHAMRVFGSVRVIVHTATEYKDEQLCLAFRIEFHSSMVAVRAVASLNKDPIWNLTQDRLWCWASAEAAGWIGPRPPNSPHRHRPRIQDRVYDDDTSRKSGHNHQGHPADAHNRVRREHILNGADVRTTIMLRNIPNKLDWMTLKSLLDQVCFGTYDFVYLRIDFNNAQNVGYAFVNFADVAGMIAMLDKVENRSWLGYRSNKNAEISYATIQGREALIQKFRNSSVMQQAWFCRPRLYAVYEDAKAMNNLRLTGTEQRFPAPNNLSKLQRSIDSAHIQGLWGHPGPNNMRGQRTTSNYDNGNPNNAAQYTNVHSLLMPDHKKRECEQWYAANFGMCASGTVPFMHIPLPYIQEFMRAHSHPAATVNDPGVIARPIATGPAHGVRSSAGGGHRARGMPGYGHDGFAVPGSSRESYEAQNVGFNLQASGVSPRRY